MPIPSEEGEPLAELATRVHRHVERLAGVIGERNVHRPLALADTADYIRNEWRQQGYSVSAQGYEVGDLWCESLAVRSSGQHPESS